MPKLQVNPARDDRAAMDNRLFKSPQHPATFTANKAHARTQVINTSVYVVIDKNRVGLLKKNNKNKKTQNKSCMFCNSNSLSPKPQTAYTFSRDFFLRLGKLRYGCSAVVKLWDL